MLQPSLLKRNLILRFMTGGRAQETMKDVLITEKREYWDSRKEWGLLSFSCSLFLLCLGNKALWWLRSCCINHPIPSLWQLHQIPWMEKTFIMFHADADSFHWCETSKTKMSFGLSGGDILLDRVNKMGTRSRVRSWQHGSKVDQHHVEHLLKISDTQGPTCQMVDVS
jgi:hypothetical protein